MTPTFHSGFRSRVRLPLGVRDFLPSAAARRRDIAERLLAVFEQWGFERIITPMFECADVLERGLGRDAQAAALRFVEPGSGEVVALRPDITPQVARLAATRLADIGGPLRLSYEGAVMRLAEGPRGQREIMQAGAEVIGAPPPRGDAEAIAVAAAALATTRLPELRLDLGHVALARYALEEIGDAERQRAVFAALVKKDRGGIAAASDPLPPDHRALLRALPSLFGDPDEVLARARELPIPAEVAAAIDGVETAIALARGLVSEAIAAGFTIDLGEVRGFEYYTGMRFSGYAEGAGEAVLQGGRYDELLSRYGEPAAATGFAVDIEAVARAQRACGVASPPPRDRVLLVGAREGGPDAGRLAALLRGEGVAAAVHIGGEGETDAALVRYARQVGFSRLVILEAGGGGRAFDTGAAGEPPAPRALKSETLAAGAAGAAAGLGSLLAALGLEARPRGGIP